MNGIKLNAELKAYSKTPFYQDYVRGVNVLPDGQEQQLDSGVLYGRRNGKWEKIFDGSMSEISNRLLALEKNDKVIENQISSISVDFDTVNDKLVYVDRLGQKYEWNIEVLVDNDTIRYNDQNRLEIKCKQDNLTIKRVVDDNGNIVYRVCALEYNKEVLNDEGQVDIQKSFISGTDLVNSIEQAHTDIGLLHKELDDITAYVQGDSYQGTALDPISLAEVYDKQEELGDNLNSAIQQELNLHALSQLEVTSPSKFPDNLKVLDTYKGDLWVFTQEDFSWKNNGSDLIVSATNDGVYGVVTGVKWDKEQYDDSWNDDDSYLKGHILSEITKDENGKTITTAPIFQINGLKDRLEDLDKTKVEKIDNKNNPYDVVYVQGADTNGQEQSRDFVQHIDITDGYLNDQVVHKESTIVKRTSSSTIITNEPTMDDEATNIIYINKKLQLFSDGVKAFTNTTYSAFINNNEDITTQQDYETTVAKGY